MRSTSSVGCRLIFSRMEAREQLPEVALLSKSILSHVSAMITRRQCGESRFESQGRREGCHRTAKTGELELTVRKLTN